MSVPREPRSAEEIRSHFLERLNLALIRPGMYGGEPALHGYLDDLRWIDGHDDGVSHVANSWGIWSPTGIGGWLARILGGEASGHSDAVALAYADIAHHWGYLRLQRALTTPEYTRLRSEARAWTSAEDRVPGDIIAAFGPPSFGRATYNPRYPVSLAYATADSNDPLVIFDFWQETGWKANPPQPGRGPEPVLRDVRWRDPGSPLFTYTPAGEALRASQPAPNGCLPGSSGRTTDKPAPPTAVL